MKKLLTHTRDNGVTSVTPDLQQFTSVNSSKSFFVLKPGFGYQVVTGELAR